MCTSCFCDWFFRILSILNSEWHTHTHPHRRTHIRTLCTLWRTHRPINYWEQGVLNLVEGQPVVSAEWAVIKESWAVAEEKATHQPLTGLDANDGNLWFTLACVRARCAALSQTFLTMELTVYRCKEIQGFNEPTLWKMLATHVTPK